MKLPLLPKPQAYQADSAYGGSSYRQSNGPSSTAPSTSTYRFDGNTQAHNSSDTQPLQDDESTGYSQVKNVLERQPGDKKWLNRINSGDSELEVASNSGQEMEAGKRILLQLLNRNDMCKFAQLINVIKSHV